MQRTLLSAKIHSCILTAANLNYVGSISIDQSLLDAAGILPYEQVQVVNVANGERLITYAIAAPANSRAIELNGAAARLGMPGDRLIIMTYAQFSHWVLNLDSGTKWTSKAPLPNPRNHFGYTVNNGQIYVIGGQHLKDDTFANREFLLLSFPNFL